MKKIGVDGQALTIKPSGVSNYLIIFLNEMLSIWEDVEFYVFLPRDLDPSVKAQLKTDTNIQFIYNKAKSLEKNSFLWRNTYLPIQLKKYKIDYFWAPAAVLPFSFFFKDFKTLLTVHDLAYKKFFSTLSWKNKILTFVQGDRSIKNADLIWTISNYTKQLVESEFAVNKEKIFVGHTVNKNIYRVLSNQDKEKAEVKRKLGLNDKFILFVGNLEPRKNLEFLLKLMPELAEKDYYLCIVGAKGWGKSNISEIINEPSFPRNNVVIPGFLSNEELLLLYNTAEMFVSTSLDEGFGMPQLEAMSCGCPVVTAHNSAMIEVVHGAGETVSGWDQADWVRAIEKVSKYREEYSKKCLERSKEYDLTIITTELYKFIFENK